MEHHAFTWLGTLTEVTRLPEHTLTGFLVAGLLVAFGLSIRSKLTNVERALNPDDGVSARNLGEVIVEMMHGLAESVIGHHSAQYVPLLATFFTFILLSNLLGLIPGFVPPTSNFNVTFALGVTSFLAYNIYGFKAAGPAYLKHFLGPALFLAPLMVIIEIMSHSFRPMSLGIRLFANLFADHELITIFTNLTKFGVPVIFYILGTLVCVVQAFVFTMLTAVYISGSVHNDH